MSKFVEIGVMKAYCSTIHVEVADKFNVEKDLEQLDLNLIAEQICDKYDWQPVQGTVEKVSIEIAQEAEAKSYAYWRQEEKKKISYKDLKYEL